MFIQLWEKPTQPPLWIRGMMSLIYLMRQWKKNLALWADPGLDLFSFLLWFSSSGGGCASDPAGDTAGPAALQAAGLLTDFISDLISVRLRTRSDRRTQWKSVRMAGNLQGFSLIFSLMISLMIQLLLISLTRSRSWCPSTPEGHQAAHVSAFQVSAGCH